jgi:hypothetical protein
MSNMDNVKKELQTVEASIATKEKRCEELNGLADISEAQFEEFEKLDKELNALKARQNQILTLIATTRGGR